MKIMRNRQNFDGKFSFRMFPVLINCMYCPHRDCINFIYDIYNKLHIQPFRNTKRQVLTSWSSENTCCIECNQTHDIHRKGMKTCWWKINQNDLLVACNLKRTSFFFGQTIHIWYVHSKKNSTLLCSVSSRKNADPYSAFKNSQLNK